MIVCPGCQNETADDALFCGFCGNKLQQGSKKTLFGVAALDREELKKLAQSSRLAASAPAPAAPVAPAVVAPVPAPAATVASAPTAAAPKPAASAPVLPTSQVLKPAKRPSEPKVKSAELAPISFDDSDDTDTPQPPAESFAQRSKPLSGLSFRMPPKSAPAVPVAAAKDTLDDLGLDDLGDDGWGELNLEIGASAGTEEEKDEFDDGLDDLLMSEDESGPTIVDVDAATMQMEIVSPKSGDRKAPPILGASKKPEPSPTPKAADLVEPATSGEAVLRSQAGGAVSFSEEVAKVIMDDSPPTSEAAPNVTPEYPSPVSGDKSDEHAFFGASLSRYGLAPVAQKTPLDTSKSEPEIGSEFKSANRKSAGMLVAALLVIGAIVGAIAYLMIVGAG